MANTYYQASYTGAIADGYEGMVSRNRLNLLEEARHYNAQGATVPVGRFVKLDAATGDLALKLPSATSDTMFGIACADTSIEADSTGVREIPVNHGVNLLQDGVVWMVPEQDVTPADPVYMRVTAGGAGQTPGRVRKDADGYVAGTKRQQTLTLNGALDGGRPQIVTFTFSGATSRAAGTKRQQTLTLSGALDGGRSQRKLLTFSGATGIGSGTRQQQTLTLSGALDAGRRRQQTLTLNQDFVAAEAVDLQLNGVAITQVLWAGSHAATMQLFVQELRQAALLQGRAVEVDLTDEATNRVVRITSLDEPNSPTSEAITNIVVTTAAGLTCTLADAVAGLAPHSITGTVGGVAFAVAWQGSHDLTVERLRQTMEGYAVVGTAETTVVPAGDDLVITVEAAAVGPGAVVFAALTVAGGTAARTLVAAETVAGVAGTGGDTFALTVDGQAIAAQTFFDDNDRYLADIARAIMAASVAAGTGPLGGPTVRSCYARPVGAAATDDRIIEIVSEPGFATVLAGLAYVDNHGGGVTCTETTPVADAAPHSLSVDVNAVTYSVPWQGAHDATVEAFAQELAAEASVESAVVVQVVAGNDLVIRLTSLVPGAATTVLANPLVVGGATPRTLTAAETVAGVAAGSADSFALSVDGGAITTQSYVDDHDRFLRTIADAILERANAAALGPNGSGTVQAVIVRPIGTTHTDDRVIEVQSKPGYATTFAGLTWTDAHGGGVTCTQATAQTNANPHSLSIQLDGAAALVQEWRGTSDATLQGFADLLASQAAIESAEVAHLTDTAGGTDDADRVITVTAATASPTANAFTNATCVGGANARTLTAAETVAGVAAVAAKAVLVPNARFLGSASAAGLVEVEIWR